MFIRLWRSFLWGIFLAALAIIPTQLHVFFLELRGVDVTRSGQLGFAIISWLVALFSFRRLGTLPRRENLASLLTWCLLVLTPVIVAGACVYTGKISFRSFEITLLMVNALVGYNMTVVRDRILSKQIPFDP